VIASTGPIAQKGEVIIDGRKVALFNVTCDSKEHVPWKNTAKRRRSKKHFSSEFPLFAQIVVAIWEDRRLIIYFF
jgi:hypothetical protein